MSLTMVAERETPAAALAERERVLRILHEEAPELRARGVTHLSLFGSVARGEAGPQSDVDLLIDLARDAPFGLFDLIDLQDQLGERFGRPVNVAFCSTLRAWLREGIEEDRIEVF
jgi:predicted nucleotidyltransferase